MMNRVIVTWQRKNGKMAFIVKNAVATNTARGIRFMPEGVKAVDMMNR